MRPASRLVMLLVRCWSTQGFNTAVNILLELINGKARLFAANGSLPVTPNSGHVTALQ
jgi:hypothetical protein